MIVVYEIQLKKLLLIIPLFQLQLEALINNIKTNEDNLSFQFMKILKNTSKR